MKLLSIVLWSIILRVYITIPEHRSVVQEHAASMNESATAFINRAIDETMARDQEKKSGQ